MSHNSSSEKKYLQLNGDKEPLNIEMISGDYGYGHNQDYLPLTGPAQDDGDASPVWQNLPNIEAIGYQTFHSPQKAEGQQVMPSPVQRALITHKNS